ncbi:hypothetical protein EmuJ_001128700 [Echinococcus multilocularis]|uniref:Uncharacterized protein n=1 Tax=Echinococcus multilocularis TaxID=6211 RepID=A0A068YJV5_ECHMU|nr:hypothetical protein EmuJ_001128700 [Echinococcus multilocularis]
MKYEAGLSKIDLDKVVSNLKTIHSHSLYFPVCVATFGPKDIHISKDFQCIQSFALLANCNSGFSFPLLRLCLHADIFNRIRVINVYKESEL